MPQHYPATCPHLTLDMRDESSPKCRQCGTPWPFVHASSSASEPTLFGGAR